MPPLPSDPVVPPQTPTLPRTGFAYMAQNGAQSQNPILLELVPGGAVGPLTPGPQITVARSVTPTAPTSVVWASSGYIDFVADCGADPTGVADCAPAFNRAFALLSAIAANPAIPETALRLFIPPGLYSVLSTPTTPWDFTGLTTSLEILGSGVDSTVFQLSGHDLMVISNLQDFHMADFTTQGTLLGASPDCTYGWFIRHVGHRLVCDRLRFFNVAASAGALTLVEGIITHVQDCTVSCCSSQGGDPGGLGGVFYIVNWQTLSVQSCMFEDIGGMNGIAPAGTVLTGNTSWVFLDFSSNPSNGLLPQASFRDCYFDENATHNVAILGSPNPVGFVEFTGCFWNPPIQGGAAPVACVLATNVHHMRFWGAFDSQFRTHPAGVPQPFANLTGVGLAEFLSSEANVTPVLDPPTTPPQILCDSTTSRIIVRDCQNFDWSAIDAPTVLDIDAPRSSGNPHGSAPLTASQIVVVSGAQVVQAATVAAAPTTVHTFYQPPASHAARVKVSWCTLDTAGVHCAVADFEAAVRFFAGVLVVAGQTASVAVGDVAVTGSAVTAAVSAANQLDLTFTPPGGFGGNLGWVARIEILEDHNFT